MNLKLRKEAHRARQAEQREAKATRTKRAPIHAAMEQAIRMKRSRKKGTANLDANMVSLGFRRIAGDGQGVPIEQKFAKVTS